MWGVPAQHGGFIGAGWRRREGAGARAGAGAEAGASNGAKKLLLLVLQLAVAEVAVNGRPMACRSLLTTCGRAGGLTELAGLGTGRTDLCGGECVGVQSGLE